jgi:enterochelin esterase-like enzyme
MRRAVHATLGLALGLVPQARASEPVDAAVPPSSPAAPAAPTATLAAHPLVRGTELSSVEISDSTRKSWRSTAFGDLGKSNLAPGTYAIRFQVSGGERVALEVPVCAGRGRVLVNGLPVAGASSTGAPVVVPLPPRPERAHDVEVEIRVGAYEHRIVCGSAPRFGAQVESRDGLGVLTFSSPHGSAGGGHAVVFIPPGHDLKKPSPLLVGAHPWNGTMWTYAAYPELLHEAAARDVILLMPSGLGNSLYTALAEDEVLRAIDAVSQVAAVDARRVSLWGASMGGAGATTIGFHHPDRFASVTSFFGDSKYDLSTYVKGILANEAAAHAVNALDVVDNARHLPVWLLHGEDDRVSPIAQSAMLARALTEHGYTVRFDRVPHAGHDGALVARHVAEVVARATEIQIPASVARVTYRSARAADTGAYGVRLVRAGSADATVDVERRADGVHVLQATGVRTIELARGALGTPAAAPPPIVIDAPNKVEARWEAVVPLALVAPALPPR